MKHFSSVHASRQLFSSDVREPLNPLPLRAILLLKHQNSQPLSPSNYLNSYVLATTSNVKSFISKK